MSTSIDPAGVAADGLTPVVGCPGVGQAAREALAAILDPDAFHKVMVLASGWEYAYRRHTALVMADRVLAAGYRLVSEEES